MTNKVRNYLIYFAKFGWWLVNNLSGGWGPAGTIWICDLTVFKILAMFLAVQVLYMKW